jgi:phospholipase D1/2
MPLQTEIFRRVFRVVPDDLVTTWKHYKDFVAYHERLLKPVRDCSYFDCPWLRTSHQLEDDIFPEPLVRVPSTGRVEQTSDEQGPQQQPRAEDASTNLHAKTFGETPAHQTNGHTRCSTPKHEKSVTEKSTGSQAGEKTGGSVPTEKVNGSAIYDKGKRTRGEPPFTKREREEMEVLLNELCGHLGQPSRIHSFEGTH